MAGIAPRLETAPSVVLWRQPCAAPVGRPDLAHRRLAHPCANLSVGCARRVDGVYPIGQKAMLHVIDDSELELTRAAGVVDVPVGYRIGDWTIQDPIGFGSWSSVYAAVSAVDRREAAVKFLAVDRLTPTQAAHLRQLAVREASCLQELDHPSLVTVFDHIVVNDPTRPELDGAVALVMERAATSVRDLLLDAGDGPLEGAKDLLADLSAALAAMHEAGWVHGDVKPANVLVMADGSVRLADFGLSGELEGTHAYLPMLGSEDFLPPEWWTEQVTVAGVTARPTRDVWAFGIVAHLVLSGGRHPFPGSSPRARSASARAYARGDADLRLHDSLPAPWQAIIRDCLAPTHEAREAHTASVLHDRIEVIDADPVTPRRRRRSLRRRTLATAGGLALAGAVAAVTIAVVDDDGAQDVEYSGGELRQDAAIPDEYRPMIVDAAHGCAKPEVTPALIAAMLKAESDFNPAKRSPATDEYGIALWTPSVFEHWQIDVDGGGPSVFSPADSIAAMGKFLCSVGDRNSHIPGDRALVLAAVYRAGGDNVRAVNGIPPAIQPYIDEVAANIDEYAEPSG
jgi:eukaryotic-like serine/threonine-protein kinase